MMMNTIENHSYWNNIPLDESFDIDQLFATTFDSRYRDGYNQSCILMEEEYEEMFPSYEVNVSSSYVFDVHHFLIRLKAPHHLIIQYNRESYPI